MGAVGGVNYNTTKDWEKPVLAFTGGAGDETMAVGHIAEQV